MAFRADEAAKSGLEEVEAYFVPRPRDAGEAERSRSRMALYDLVDELGPVVDAYPTWHPLVSNHSSRHAITVPGTSCGYKGLDHTRHFVNGFITCPYGDGQEVLDSVAALPGLGFAYISARRLKVQFYSPEATPILVKCEWERAPEMGGTIPLAVAMPLILEREVPCWRWSEVAETWETMRPYFLGRPHGSRSSLFVTQETGVALKRIWTDLIFTGMFGPIKV